MQKNTGTAKVLKRLSQLLVDSKIELLALVVVIAWTMPMLSTRSQIEWGDFSYFAQIYEAIKISILNYHQFPWWNPWIAGGIPLYANPQAGVFSITALMSLVLSTPIALKLTIFIFYILGYLSLIWLLRHFNIRGPIAALLGLSWVLNGFFVAHLPAHFTFIWFLVAPAFIRLALTVKDRTSGLVLGAALAAMALAQMHYSFVLIGMVVAVILTARTITNQAQRLQIITSSLWALGLFVVLAGHRALLTLHDANSFPRQVFDPTSKIVEDAFSFLTPYSYNFGVEPVTKPFYGWNEQTAYPSVFVVSALIIAAVAYIALRRQHSAQKEQRLGAQTATLMAMLATMLVGAGGRQWFAPYYWLKLFPVLSQMRIASRWFIFTDLSILVFIGLSYVKNQHEKYYRQLLLIFVGLAVIELFVLNFGYQAKVLSHIVMRPNRGTTFSQLTFGQNIRFGETQKTPDGLPIPGADKQYLYREYESTLFNIGTILANEVFVNIYDNDTPRCSYSAGCGLVLSGNAHVSQWSPDRLVLVRTAPGLIELNINPSSYMLVNGKRLPVAVVADLHAHFYLPVSEKEQKVVISYSPRLL